MKVLSLIAPMFVFALLSTVNYYISNDYSLQNGMKIDDTYTPVNGGNTELLESSVRYNVKAALNPEEKLISVNSSIKISDAHSIVGDTLIFFLGVNDILTNPKANKSINRRLISFNNYKFGKIEINGIGKELKFYDAGIDGLADSIIGYIITDSSDPDGNVLKISLDYEIRVLPGNPALGYAFGKEFYYVSSWLPHVIPSTGKIGLDKAFMDNLDNPGRKSDYSVDLTLPEGYKLISSGETTDSTGGNGQNTFKILSENSSGISWIATQEIKKIEFDVQLSSDHVTRFKLFIQPENERYIDRYHDAAVNTLSYLQDKFKTVQLKTISLVDIPQTSRSAYLASGNLITVKSEILSVKGLAEIEYYTAKMISRQFFKKALNLESSVNNWIIEGLSSLYANVIVNKFFEAPKLSFKFAYHYPVYGMNHLSFKDIPVVYSLTELEYDLGLKKLSNYYGETKMGSINDCFYNYPDLNAYINNKHIKPYLLFKSLIEENGIDHFSTLLNSNVINDISKEASRRSDNFIKMLNGIGTTSLDQFTGSPVYVDYAIRSVEQVDTGKYRVIAERIGDAVCSGKVLLYTEGEEIEYSWSGEERFKSFTFVTDKPVKAAEIRLTDTKYLDINFANNSYTTENQYWGSLSLAVRIFFWFQNAIMIFGSAS